MNLNIRWTNISEVHFTVPSVPDSNSSRLIENYAEHYKRVYEAVQELRMIEVPNLGWFQIRDIKEVYSDGILVKECVAYSAEVMLQNKQVINLEGEYKLYDPLKPYESLLGILLLKIPGWKVGDVDGTILTRQRTINISKQNLYTLLTKDLSEAYECLFIFDYKNYLIHIVDVSKGFKENGIFLTYKNLIKSSTVTTMTDRIVTALYVKGGNFDISGVNPNGSDILYNVDYYKDRMSQGLLNSLTTYEDKYKALQAEYADLLLQLKNLNNDLAILKSNPPQYEVDFQPNQDGTLTINPTLNATSGLDQLQALRKALEGIRAARIEKGNIPYTDVNAMINKVDPMITTKNAFIKTKETNIESITAQLNNIVIQLKMENNFSEDEWKELNQYFIYDTFQDDTFVWTDIMTKEEKQELQQELFDCGVRALARSSFPRYQFEIDPINFLAISKSRHLNVDHYRNNFELGTTFELELGYYTVEPLLLGMDINFDDFTDFKLIYANKVMLDDGFDLIDYVGGTAGTINTISFDLVKLEAMKKQSDDVTAFINGALDTSVNELISSKNRTAITINETGARARSYDWNTEQLLPFESWWTGSQLAFSDDNFTTSRLALGRITAPGSLGGTLYGLVGDVVVGHLVASNNLHVSNDKNNFKLDETGAWLDNANFVITKTQGGITSKIVLDPIEGFAIYKNNIKNVFIQSSGDVEFKGHITAGTISLGTNGAFKVDQNGNVNIGQGQATISSTGYAVFNDVHIRNKSDYMVGDYNKGDNGVYIDEDGILHARGGIFSGTVTATNMNASTITGTSITSESTSGYGTASMVNGFFRQVLGSKYVQVYNGEIGFGDSSYLYGAVSYDTAGTGGDNPQRLFVRSFGGRALKLLSNGNMSIEANGNVYAASDWIFSNAPKVGTNTLATQQWVTQQINNALSSLGS